MVINKHERLKQKRLIFNLMKDSKYEFAKKEIEDYMEKYNDIEMNVIYGNILYKLGYVDMAREAYQNGAILDDKYALLALTKLSFEFNDFLYSYFLIKKCKKFNYDKTNHMNLYFGEIYIKIRLGLKINSFSKDSFYTEKQLVSYSEEAALEHITRHYEKEPIFNKEIDVNILFEKVKENINESTFSYNNFDRIAYYFNYPNAGFNEGVKADYLLVITIRDTNEILNIYPVSKDKIKNDCFINDFEKEKKLIYLQSKTRVSQIDKFNKKYSKFN